MVKVGDKVVMYFHLMGLVSNELLEVVSVDDKCVYLDRGEDTPWKFSKKTGVCLNDNTWGGAKRTIDPIKD